MEFDEFFQMGINGCSDIEAIFDRFFGFLQRRTDVYHVMIESDDYDSKFGVSIDEINGRGFPPGHVRTIISKIFDKYAFKYVSERQPYILNSNKFVKKYLGITNCIKDDVQSYTSDVNVKSFNTTNVQSNNDVKVQSCNTSSKYVNVHNGGITKHYSWSQGMGDLTIEVDCGQSISKGDVDVKITSTELKIKTPKFNINGEWCRKILPDNEFNWFVQDKRIIVISIDKAEECWWDCLLKGDPTIDTQKIESVKKLSELDEKTQHFICNEIIKQGNNMY